MCSVILQAVRKDGVPRTRSECDRGGTKWYSREVLVAKDTSWMDEIANETIKVGVTTNSLLDQSECSNVLVCGEQDSP